MIKDADVESVICMDTNFCYVKEALAATDLKRVIVTNLVDTAAGLETGSWDIYSTRSPRARWTLTRRAASLLLDLIRHAPLSEAVNDRSDRNDLSYILYTGGTTGFPKGVPGNHIGMTSYVNDVTEDVAGECISKRARRHLHRHQSALSYHGPGPVHGRRAKQGQHHRTDARPPRWTPSWSPFERFKVRWLLGVPALYRMILENDRQERYDLSSLTYCYCGGDVLPEEVKERWQQTLRHRPSTRSMVPPK